MELWFLATLAATILAGLSNYLFKMAAKLGFNAELFSLYGSVASVFILIPVAFVFGDISVSPAWAIIVIVVAGAVAAVGGIGKIYALRFIDTTIYFPLLKLLSPTLAIGFGILFFQEAYALKECVGLMIGIFVPLLLINKAENKRQQNLLLGLLLVLITGAISAGFAAASKWSIDLTGNVLAMLVFAAFGVVIGSIFSIWFRQGATQIMQHARLDTTPQLFWWSVLRGMIVSMSLGFILYAYNNGGSLAIVHTVHSLYILIPIVLAIIFYNEHWNVQKVAAILLSVTALALLG